MTARRAFEIYTSKHGEDGDPGDVEALPYALAAATMRIGDGARPRETVDPIPEVVSRLGLLTWGFGAARPGSVELSYAKDGRFNDLLDGYLEAARRRAGPGCDPRVALHTDGTGLSEPASPDGPVDLVAEIWLVEQTMSSRDLAGLARTERLMIAGPELEMGEHDWAEPAYAASDAGGPVVVTRPSERAVRLLMAMAADIRADRGTEDVG